MSNDVYDEKKEVALLTIGYSATESVMHDLCGFLARTFARSCCIVYKLAYYLVPVTVFRLPAGEVEAKRMQADVLVDKQLFGFARKPRTVNRARLIGASCFWGAQRAEI